MSIDWKYLKSKNYANRFSEVSDWLEKTERCQQTIPQKSRRHGLRRFLQIKPLRFALLFGLCLFIIAWLPVERTITIGYILECTITKDAEQSEQMIRSLCWYNTENVSVCETIHGASTVSNFQVAFFDVADDNVAGCIAALNQISEVTSIKIQTVDRSVTLTVYAQMLDAIFQIRPGTIDISDAEKEAELRKRLLANQCV